MPFKYSVLGASKLVSTKTPLLKHYYCRQGKKSSSLEQSGVPFLFPSKGALCEGVFVALVRRRANREVQTVN